MRHCRSLTNVVPSRPLYQDWRRRRDTCPDCQGAQKPFPGHPIAVQHLHPALSSSWRDHCSKPAWLKTQHLLHTWLSQASVRVPSRRVPPPHGGTEMTFPPRTGLSCWREKLVSSRDTWYPRLRRAARLLTLITLLSGGRLEGQLLLDAPSFHHGALAEETQVTAALSEATSVNNSRGNNSSCSSVCYGQTKEALFARVMDVSGNSAIHVVKMCSDFWNLCLSRKEKKKRSFMLKQNYQNALRLLPHPLLFSRTGINTLKAFYTLLDSTNFHTPNKRIIQSQLLWGMDVMSPWQQQTTMSNKAPVSLSDWRCLTNKITCSIADTTGRLALLPVPPSS